MSKVIQFPTKHRDRPKCPHCGTKIPTFDGANLDVFDFGDSARLDAITFHITCKCGNQLELRKEVK